MSHQHLGAGSFHTGNCGPGAGTLPALKCSVPQRNYQVREEAFTRPFMTVGYSLLSSQEKESPQGLHRGGLTSLPTRSRRRAAVVAEALRQQRSVKGTKATTPTSYSSTVRIVPTLPASADTIGSHREYLCEYSL
ncbi:hypothetical protein [Bacteriophage sp.]|nr:hypothetical protein [Caudoviricetes sp.]UOF80006.1 hypothetical protein [Bacteriophage sp.]